MNLGFDCRADIIDFVENEEDLENVEKSIVALFVVCLLLGVNIFINLFIIKCNKIDPTSMLRMVGSMDRWR